MLKWPAPSSNLRVTRRAIDSARSSLAVLLGKGPDRGLDIQRPQLLAPSQMTIPSSLPVELLGHRADVVAARWQVEAAGKDIKSAKTEFLPNISIGALAGFIALGGGNPFTLPQRFYQVGPTLSLPIFDGGRLRANLNGKDAQYDLAVAQYNQTLVRALNEVSDGLSAMRSLDEQLAAQQRAQDAAQAGLRPGPATLQGRHRQLSGSTERAPAVAVCRARHGRAQGAEDRPARYRSSRRSAAASSRSGDVPALSTEPSSKHSNPSRS